MQRKQRAWLREFNSLGLQLRPQAAKLVTEFLQTTDDPQQMAEVLVTHTKNYFRTHQGTVEPIIDSEVIQRVITIMHDQSADVDPKDEKSFEAACCGIATLNLGDGVQVYNVLKDMIPYEFDRANKQWHPRYDGSSLFPGVSSKSRIYADRYHTIWQRLLIQGPYVAEVDAAAGGALPGQQVLTPVESLVGNLGNKVTFGLLSRAPDDGSQSRSWIIEDTNRAYPILFDEDSYGSWNHQLVTDGSFVLAEGTMTRDCFHARRLVIPETIPRSLSEERDQVPAQVFGGSYTDDELHVLKQAEIENPDGMYVVFSEVHLDSVRTMEKLSDIFQGYESASPPSAYIFMGSFCSTPFLPTGDGIKTYREGFERLKLDMQKIPNHVKCGTRFIFIPGPQDPGPQRLPQAPLSDYVTSNIAKEIPNVILATNPCRIRHFTKEMVFFRHDVLKVLRRHEVVPLRDPNQTGPPSSQHVQNEMARFLLDQAHLVPLPLRESNILWDFDHTLRLYPLPHAVFIGGASQPFDLIYQDCKFCSVGPFCHSSFYAYSPVSEEMDACDAPDRAG